MGWRWGQGKGKEGLWGAGMGPGVVAYCHGPRHPSQAGLGCGESTPERSSVRGGAVFSGGRQPGKGGDRGGREGSGTARKGKGKGKGKGFSSGGLGCKAGDGRGRVQSWRRKPEIRRGGECRQMRSPSKPSSPTGDHPQPQSSQQTLPVVQ